MVISEIKNFLKKVSNAEDSSWVVIQTNGWKEGEEWEKMNKLAKRCETRLYSLIILISVFPGV